MLRESKSAGWFIRRFGKLQSAICSSTKNSTTAGLLSTIRHSFSDKAVESASVVAFTAVTVNIILELMLNREMGGVEVSIKGAVLLLSLGGFSSKAVWREIKKGSFILSKILK